MPGLTTIQLVVSAYLVGLIWLIQLAHYPAFRAIAADQWSAFHRLHTSAMGLLAGGPMIVALVVGAWLSGRAVLSPGGGDLRQHLVLACELVAWGVTFLVAVPLHDRLAGGPDPALIDRLISSNWVRTAAWTAKLALLVFPAG
jgi:hypothetical protein